MNIHNFDKFFTTDISLLAKVCETNLISHCRDMFSMMVIVFGNGISDLSLNPGQNCLCFTLC